MSIEDRLNQETETLSLEAGASAVGILRELTLRDSDYGEPYPVVTIEKADGSEVVVHGYHSVLKNRLLELDPRPGDQLGIKCLGTRTGKSGTSYMDYRVVIERDEVAAASAAVAEATAAHDAAVARNDLLIPIMEEHGFATAGEAIDYLEANPPAAQALEVSKLKQYEDEEPW